MEMSTDWGNAVVIDPRQLRGLEDAKDALLRTRDALLSSRSRLRRTIVGLTLACGTAIGAAYLQSSRVATLALDLEAQRETVERSGAALAALARSQDNILSATEHAPSVGTKSWGRRFTVTKYLARSEAYGKDNDGFTATMTKADPKARIVAVDPKLVPYGSWVWIESLGWYHAEDCGGAIKGFRLDVMTGNERDAMDFGKQDRFVIVVPPEGA